MVILSRDDAAKTYLIDGRFESTNDMECVLEDITTPLHNLSEIAYYELQIWNKVITRRKLDELVELMNKPLPKVATATSWKWTEIALFRCIFAQPGMILAIADDDDYCSLEDRTLLASTLAGRTERLFVLSCPDILDSLFHIPRLEVNEWGITQDGLTALECARVGDLIQSSTDLTSLQLKADYLEDPLVLAQAFANAAHLQYVYFDMNDQPSHQQPGRKLSDAIVRYGWNGIVGRLLQLRLKVLSLSEMQLEDSHFMVIAEMLPTSQIESLCLHENNLGLQSILAFAQQLPMIEYLKEGCLGLDTWQHVREQRDECYAALRAGMLDNYSIESLDPGCEDALLVLYTQLNRAGRRILSTSSPVPSGLWALVLERAGRRRDDDPEPNHAPSQCVYFFLQSAPLQSIFLTHGSRSSHVSL